MRVELALRSDGGVCDALHNWSFDCKTVHRLGNLFARNSPSAQVTFSRRQCSCVSGPRRVHRRILFLPPFCWSNKCCAKNMTDVPQYLKNVVFTIPRPLTIPCDGCGNSAYIEDTVLTVRLPNNQSTNDSVQSDHTTGILCLNCARRQGPNIACAECAKVVYQLDAYEQHTSNSMMYVCAQCAPKGT